MIWVYIAIAIAVIILILFYSKKGKDPTKDASLTIQEKEKLDEDYLSHGGHDQNDDNKNI